jgi:hypothetical protein
MVSKIAVTPHQKAVADALQSEREKRRRLARELAKLSPADEKRMAEEGLMEISE